MINASIDPNECNRLCVEIADRVVPRYRCQKPYPSCTGTIAKRWEAAYYGASAALGGPATPAEDPRVQAVQAALAVAFVIGPEDDDDLPF